jgi:hypothetical protein
MARRGTDKVRFPGSVFFSDDGVKEHHFQEVREQFNNGSLDPCRWLRGLDCGGTFGRGQLKKQGKLTSQSSLGNVTKTCHTSMERMANPSNYFTSSSKEYSERVGTPPENSLVPLYDSWNAGCLGTSETNSFCEPRNLTLYWYF